MREQIIKYVKICLIVLVLEVILFNITSFRTFFGNYTVKEFTKEDFEIISAEDGIAKVKIDNIHSPIATINLQLENIGSIFEYAFGYSDETSVEYEMLPSKKYITIEERTHYIPCYLSGNVNYLILDIHEELVTRDFIEKVVINERIPFDFNFLRVALLIFIFVIVDIFKNSKVMNSNYEESNLKQELILLAVLFVFAMLITFINVKSNDEDRFDMYNNGLVESLLNKKIYLLQEPSEAFKELENPYDFTNRTMEEMYKGKDYVWDSAYYNEKFYVYFGILPVLIMFLPFYMLTGEYLQCATACLVISIIILIFLKEILCKFYKKYFNNIPFKLVVFSLMILYAGSMIFSINGAARFYEVPILAGVCCVLVGIFFVLKSMNKPEKKYRFIFLGCLFMALSVACRPTNVISSLLIVPY